MKIGLNLMTADFVVVLAAEVSCAVGIGRFVVAFVNSVSVSLRDFDDDYCPPTLTCLDVRMGGGHWTVLFYGLLFGLGCG